MRGVDRSAGLESPLPETTPQGENVRLFDPATNRARGGMRPTLRKYVAGAAGAGRVQCLDYVVHMDHEAGLDHFNWGDNPGEEPSGGIADPSGPGWYYGPLDLLDPLDVPLVGTPGFEATVPPGSASLARLRPRNGTRLGGSERILRSGGSGRQPSWQRRRGQPQEEPPEPEPGQMIRLIQSKGLLTPSDSFDAAVTLGSLLVVGAVSVGLLPGFGVDSVSDSLGHSYTRIGDVRRITNTFSNTEATLSLWYAVATASGTCTVSVNPSFNRYLCVLTEWEGVLSGFPLVAHGGNAVVQPPFLPSPTTMSTGNVATLGSGELLFGVFFYNTGRLPGTPAPSLGGTGFTQVSSAGSITLSSYKIGAANEAASYSYSPNTAGGTGWAAIGATFRPAT